MNRAADGSPRSRRLVSLCAATLGAACALPVQSQTSTDTTGPWRFGATLYLYLYGLDCPLLREAHEVAADLR